MVFPILPANTLSGGYDIDNSLRFNNDAELEFTPSSEGNRTTFTISVWVKRGGLGTDFICSSGTGSGAKFELSFTSTDQLWVESSSGVTLQTAAKYRDPSAWMHIVFKHDSTPATPDSSDVALYVNGSQITSFDTYETYPSQNNGCYWMDDVEHNIGKRTYADVFFDGYMAEFVAIDGLALSPSSFGETDEDSGIWKPKDVSGLTFGTNGFYLEFKGTGASQDSSGIGADTSGEDNHFAVTNLAATDQTTDTPTNNFATFNPLMTYPNITSGTPTPLAWSEGNTKVTGSGSGTGFTPTIGSIGVSNGKWYYEFYTSTDDSGTKVGGAMDNDFTANGDKDIHEAFYGVRASNGTFYYNDSTNGSLTNATEWKDDGDILSVALNLDDMEISFSTNGASYTAAQSITGNAATSGTLHPAIYLADNEIVTVNFGNPNWALSSGNADANGYGNFEYAVPSGFYAVCTKNLAEYG